MTDATVKPQPLVTDVPTFLEDLVLHQAARSWQEHRAGNWPAGEHRDVLSKAFYRLVRVIPPEAVLASTGAAEWADKHWRGGRAALFDWQYTAGAHPHQRAQEGVAVSSSGLHLEHVVTGGMFRQRVERDFQEHPLLEPLRQGQRFSDVPAEHRLEVARELAHWVGANYRVAWVLRETEKPALNRGGFQSQRGEGLASALAGYRERGILLWDRDGNPATAG